MIQVVQRILDNLQKLSQWVDEIEPAPVGASRFGNVAFRKWMDRLNANVEEIMQNIAPDLPAEGRAEIGVYLTRSFGDYGRIDYGTGHEAHFLAWL